jgi:O-antigen/teichoic acid export membrane protein
MGEVPKGVLSFIISIGAILAMLAGLWLVFERLKQKNQGFGPNSLKALGLVLFLPSLVMIAVQRENFHTETLAALLGTVAGYVLSHSKGDDT